MTALPIAPPPERRLLPAPARTTKEVGWWGMALLCATEGAFFAFLIASYFYLGVRNPAWPPSGIEKPSLLLPGVMTATLLASSACLYWGERGIRRGEQGRLRAGIGAAIVLGAAFLVLQWREYHEKLRHFVPQTHAYASVFYTTTGFHGAHVAFGLLALAYTGVRALLGHFDAHEHLGVSVVSLYWHFVDGVWLVIVASLYLSPHLY